MARSRPVSPPGGWLALLTALLAGPAPAADRLGLSVATVDGPGFTAHDVAIEIDLSGPDPAGQLHIARMELAALVTPLRDLTLSCGRMTVPPATPGCHDGRLRSADPVLAPLLGTSGLGLSGRREADGTWRVELDARRFLDGALSLRAQLATDSWRASGTLRGINLAALLALTESLLGTAHGISATGTASGSFEVTAPGNEAPTGQLRLNVAGLTAANAASTVATDSLSGVLEARFQPTASGQAINGRAELSAGYAYAASVLQDLSTYPARAEFRLERENAGLLNLRQLRWEQPGVITTTLRGVIAPDAAAPVRRLAIDIAQAEFPGLYTQLLVPFTAGTRFDELDSGGRLRGRIELVDAQPVAVDLDLNGVNLDDRERRFAFYDLTGQLGWRATGALPESTLAWSGVYLGQLAFGPATWRFRAGGNRFESLGTLRVGVFDGAIAVSRFVASGLGEPEPEVLFQAALEPVSLALVTAAFGWPSFPGRLAGRLPPLRYAAGRLVLDGALEAELFGGRLEIAGATVTDPLGRVPRARADLRLRDLDLGQLTSVFDFGRIDGRLDADVLGLRLQAWEPVAFEARLQTPPGDRSRRRISQRAVQNVSRVGGGGAVAALSGGIMRFFESFGYRRIAWSCRLQQGVCTMGGGKRTEDGGYLIVEGSGLPRIDVVGHADRVSWSSLLKQLRAVSGNAPATVE